MNPCTPPRRVAAVVRASAPSRAAGVTALAATATLSALLAMPAQASSTLTVFGTVDLGVEQVAGNLKRQTGLGNSALGSSSLGFRGTEDLGGGYSAGFWLEMGLMPSNGTTQGTNVNNQSGGFLPGVGFGRRVMLTLKAPAGELRLGRDYVPSFWNYAFYDPFGASSVAAAMNNFSGTGYAQTFVRASNGVSYLSPVLAGGLQLQLTAAAGENASTAQAPGHGGQLQGTRRNGQYLGLRLSYAKGPLDLGLSAGRSFYAPGTNALGWFGYAEDASVTASGNYTDLSLGGAYDFGPAKLMGNLSRQVLADVDAAGASRATRGFTLGVVVPQGRITWKAALSQVALQGQGRSTKLGLGGDYAFSKRTAVYAIAARVGNRGYRGTATGFSAASFSLTGFGGPGFISQNQSSRGLDLGLKHEF